MSDKYLDRLKATALGKTCTVNDTTINLADTESTIYNEIIRVRDNLTNLANTIFGQPVRSITRQQAIALFDANLEVFIVDDKGIEFVPSERDQILDNKHSAFGII